MWTETEMYEVHPDSVGAVLRRTRPNSICIPNRPGS